MNQQKDLAAKQKELDVMIAGMQKTWEEHCKKVAAYRAAQGCKK